MARTRSGSIDATRRNLADHVNGKRSGPADQPAPLRFRDLGLFATNLARRAGALWLQRVGVLARVGEAASDPEFDFQIKRIALFCSMLGNAPRVSDLDLALKVIPRFDGQELTNAISNASSSRSAVESTSRACSRLSCGPE